MGAKRKPSAWDLQYYEIHARVTGMRYGETGLGYHCDYDLCVEGLSGGKEWVVDHLASGRAIAKFHAQARAQYFIEQVAHYTNWNDPAEILAQQADLWPRVQEAAQAAAKWKLEQANKLLNLKQQLLLKEESEVQG